MPRHSSLFAANRMPVGEHLGVLIQHKALEHAPDFELDSTLQTASLRMKRRSGQHKQGGKANAHLVVGV